MTDWSPPTEADRHPSADRPARHDWTGIGQCGLATRLV